MPFGATLDGEPVSALVCDDALWERARAASEAGTPPLVLPCCGRRAFAKRSPIGTRFFQHAPHARAEAECPHEGESEAHREIKKAVAIAVDGYEGWTADVEFSAADWRADVLARHRGGMLPPVAFEVQLSSQPAEETGRREAGYERGGVVAVWIVNRHNDRASFGSDRRLPLPPETDGLEARARAAARGAVGYLRRLAWQVGAVEAAAAEIARHTGPVEVGRDGAVPASITAPGLGRRAGVRLVFAVAGLRSQAGGNPKGHSADDEPAPLFVRWDGKKGYRSIHRHALPVAAGPPEEIARALVADIAEGRLCYLPTFALPAALVHYTETCRGCFAEIEVCRWAVIGGGRFRPSHVPGWLPANPPFVVPASELYWPGRSEHDPWMVAARRLGSWQTIEHVGMQGVQRECRSCYR
ncbi:MAG: hypothetical protein K2X74_19040, partial [Acetobacteraceae bacterium]|nr:hypothetical protein [Acetobacteraceae bacterium]